MSDIAPGLTRRHTLGLAAGLTAGALLVPAAGAAVAAPAERAWKGTTSQNGWPVVDQAVTHRVEGTNVDVPLVEGDVATVLLYVARRYAYEIDMLRPEEVRGHTADRHIGAPFESNHLSGTAIAVRPLFYPLGADASTGMTEQERTVVRDILADCEGVVAWGGELAPVKESHFQIAVAPGDTRLARLARRIKGWDAAPGQGAGSIDAFAPARIRRADKAADAR
ncbi:hypothetical protein [Streptomyces sp. NPDC056948]|uniref:hypothetical protein n=1 Tax=Streptomyces sp. NPDC056948 TaxID=3345975 RepID=UPI003637E57F